MQITRCIGLAQRSDHLVHFSKRPRLQSHRVGVVLHGQHKNVGVVDGAFVNRLQDI